MANVISVENLSKRYLLTRQRQHGSYLALRDELASGVRRLGSKLIGRGGGERAVREEFWALKEVSFEVEQGDRIGIIGRNGAGKSTLLKVLSRISEPTTGCVRIRGRVASLLEVGTGFHPELTGRENIFLNGAVLGMSRAEIRRKFDEIVDFAEVETFLDTPVKRYSSGMYVRLAFAVAAHLEPEILVVDEVLAVGDARFQKKCLGKMEEVSARQGRTVLFVSHNMEAVQNLCSRAVLLERGRLLSSGSTAAVVSQYIEDGCHVLTRRQWEGEEAPGNDHARLMRASVQPLDGGEDSFFIDTPFQFTFEFDTLHAGQSNLDVTYHLVDERGILVYVGSTGFSRCDSFGPGRLRARCLVPGNLLNEGVYTVTRLLLVRNRGEVLLEQPNLLTFELHSRGSGQAGWVGQKEGVIKPILEWELESD
jgi:lipopolysaccharide transport system ATP-binding protein